MSRTDEIRNSPYQSNRQKLAEERRKQTLIDTARQHSEIMNRILAENAERKAEEKMLFLLWYMLDRKLAELEDIRDRNKPKTIDEEWNEPFRYAIEKIPEVKHTLEDAWFAYINVNRTEFLNYL